MKRTKTLIVAAAISLTSLIPRTSFIPFTSITAYASSKIHSVSIKFTINGYDDTGMPEIEAVKANDSEINYRDAKYSVDLTVEDGYTFSVTDAGKVKNLGGEIGSNAGPKGNKL